MPEMMLEDKHHHHIITRVSRVNENEEPSGPPQHHHHVLQHSDQDGQVHHHLVHHGLGKEETEDLENCDWAQITQALDFSKTLPAEFTILDNFLECCFEPQHQPEFAELQHNHSNCDLDYDLTGLERLLFPSCPIVNKEPLQSDDCTACEDCTDCSECTTSTACSECDTTEIRCEWEGCPRGFGSTSELHNHIVEDHIGSGKSRYECKWVGCTRNGRGFSQRQKAVRHVLVHSKDRPFECPECHKRFSTEEMRDQHVRIHTGEKPYKCKYCDKRFKTTSSLCVHTRLHTGQVRCQWPRCTRTFKEGSHFAKHYKSHYRTKVKSEQLL